ncbi:MAG: hypothetical protein ACI8RA_002280, partial [Chlamydiales bacterium]
GILLIIAEFGGHKNRKSDPPPGVKAIWKSLCKTHEYARALDAFDQIPANKNS